MCLKFVLFCANNLQTLMKHRCMQHFILVSINDAVSDQYLHCLLTECSIKIWEKNEIPKNGNELVVLISGVKSIRL